jgi:hypothetical protein
MPSVLTKVNSKTLHSRAREIMTNAHEFMISEAELGLQISLREFGKKGRRLLKEFRKEQYGILFRKGEI